VAQPWPSTAAVVVVSTQDLAAAAAAVVSTQDLAAAAAAVVSVVVVLVCLASFEYGQQPAPALTTESVPIRREVVTVRMSFFMMIRHVFWG
jgi:hypothetical protein